MKKRLSIFLCIVLFASSCWSLEPSYNRYKTEVHFLFATPQTKNTDKPYRESCDDIHVGDRFELRIDLKIKCGLFSKLIRFDSGRTIPVYITIPNTDILEFSVSDTNIKIGQSTEDTIKNVRTITLYVHADTNPDDVSINLRCKSLKEGVQLITVDFGEDVNHDHHKEHEIHYIK